MQSAGHANVCRFKEPLHRFYFTDQELDVVYRKHHKPCPGLYITFSKKWEETFEILSFLFLFHIAPTFVTPATEDVTFICESARYACFRTITTKLWSQTVNLMWLLQLSHILPSPVFDLTFENILQPSIRFLPLGCNVTATGGGSSLQTAPDLLLWKDLMGITDAKWGPTLCWLVSFFVSLTNTTVSPC